MIGSDPVLPDIHGITRPDRKLLTLYVLRAAALALLGPWFFVVVLPYYFKYKTLNYRFDGEGIGVSWGLLWRREIYLTYARIQDIHLSRGVLERWLGLATIQIQTAAGSSTAEMSIVGLTEYEAVRDFLYARMRGAHLDEPAIVRRSDSDDGATALLTEIRDELRDIRQLLADQTRGAS